MNAFHRLGQTIRADFLERTRRYSFLITLGAMIYLGYLAVPAPDAGVLTVDLGNLRGVYNTAWIGGLTALLSTALLSLPGFYLVKNSISRDRRTRVGQIIAATPLTKTMYILAKTLSNFVYLASIALLMLAAAGVMQFIRGEVLAFRLETLILPYVFITLPVMLIVSAAAVFFETLPLLQGGFGNLAYFALWLVILIASMSGVRFGAQGAIQEPVNDLLGASLIGHSMHQAASAAYPDRRLDFGVGYTRVEGEIATFQWSGLDWSWSIAMERLLWAGAGLVIAGAGSIMFRRFDPARLQPGKLEDTKDPTAFGRFLDGISLPKVRILPQARLSNPPFLRLVCSEIKLVIKGQSWWWYLTAVGFILGGFLTADYGSLKIIWLAAWIWPVLIWSGLGVRETENHTGGYVFSTPGPIRRLLPAQWLSGWFLTVLTGAGVGGRLLLLGEPGRFLAWAAAAAFIPSLALALGVWTGTSRTFEAFYVALWYLGPVSGLTELDFFGITSGAVRTGMPWIVGGLSVILLVLSWLGRRLDLR
jgi:hypothetical protein